MRIIKLTLSLLLAALALPQLAHAAEAVSVHTVLIMASKTKAKADPRVAPYEAQLQRNLPESSFRFVDEGTTKVSGRGNATISLAQGHRVEIEGEDKNTRDGISLKVRWMNGDKVMVSGAFIFERGTPQVIVRRPSDDSEIPIVIVIAK
jgi:hypothetical protein